MSFFPSPEPLSASPDPKRYEQVLQRAAAGAGNHGVDAAAWSIDDAAAYWLPGWEPPTPQNECVPADMVMGVVTFAFITLTYEVTPIGKFFATLGHLRAAYARGKNHFEGISPHAYCRAAHEAFAPNVKNISERLHWVGLRSLAETSYRRCPLPDCQESESLLGHCLPKAMFDNALRSRLLRPTRCLDASPLTLLITRLNSWRHIMPYITVRDGNTHVKCLHCPYWAYDAIIMLTRVIPALLVDADHQLLIRASVAESIATYHELKRELPRREPRLVTMRPVDEPVETEERRLQKLVDSVWRSSGATAGWASHMPGWLDGAIGKELR